MSGAGDRRAPQRALVNFCRWVLVPLSGVAVWYVVLLLGIASITLLDSLCPPDLVVSGSCTAGWYEPVFQSLLFVCSVGVAIGIVLVPALVAPTFRWRVALLAFGCGAAFATYVVLEGFLWLPLLGSVLGGSYALWLAAAKWRVR